MAIDSGTRGFPKIPAKNWWELRRRFQKSIPAQVTSSYLQSVLSVMDGHAKNLIPQLQTVGLVDESGKPTPLANEWRSDEGYKDACEKIIASVYPQELRDVVPPSEPDRQAATNWFMRERGVGESAAKQMASFYTLVAEADPAAMTQVASPSRTPSTARRTQKPREEKRRQSRDRARPAAADEPLSAGAGQESSPALHIDVQIHIPSDATSEQIDAIFASMAKHLYGKR